jgi:L-threonylcarbamoyladenylate synthase
MRAIFLSHIGGKSIIISCVPDTTIISASDENYKEAVQSAVPLLRSGEVVAVPTETVYGLAGNAFDEKAVAKIFSAKERPSFDPLIVHVATRAELARPSGQVR